MLAVRYDLNGRLPTCLKSIIYQEYSVVAYWWFFVNLIWYLYLFELNKHCLSLSESESFWLGVGLFISFMLFDRMPKMYHLNVIQTNQIIHTRTKKFEGSFRGNNLQLFFHMNSRILIQYQIKSNHFILAAVIP